jgi:acetyl-CoA C-acetyltransferase
MPVNPSGGLLAKGHPIGATGVAQLIEIARQLRGESDNQVEGAELGLAHNVGGTGGVCVVTVMGRTG